MSYSKTGDLGTTSNAMSRLEIVGTTELSGLLYSIVPEEPTLSSQFTSLLDKVVPDICNESGHFRAVRASHLQAFVKDEVVEKSISDTSKRNLYMRIPDLRTLAMAGAMLDLSIESPMYLGRLWGDRPFRDFEGEKPRIRFLRAIVAHPEGVAQKRLAKLMKVPDTTHVQQHLRPFVRLGMASVERIPSEQGYYFTARAARLKQPYFETVQEGLRRLDENASGSEAELAGWANRACEIAENRELVAKLFEKPYDSFFPHSRRRSSSE